MRRRLWRWIFDDSTRRAVDETLADHHHDARRAGFGAKLRTTVALVRVVGSSAAGASILRHVTRDVRYALRRLRATPVFTAFGIVTLALGIGVTATVYAAVHSRWLRPPDVPHLDRVVAIRHAPGSRLISWLDFEALRSLQSSFDRVAGTAMWPAMLTAEGQAADVTGEAVTGEYFDVLGLRPAAGRLIQPADNEPDASGVVVISDRLWDRLFDRSPAAMGRGVSINGHQVVVVGVMPPRYRGVLNSAQVRTDVWLPTTGLSSIPQLTTLLQPTERATRRLHVLARLAPGRTVTDALDDVRRVADRLDTIFPITDDVAGGSSRYPERPWVSVPLRDVGASEAGVGWTEALTILGVIGLVLLVACSNLANMMLARGAARAHEVIVRMALGASRWRLVRESFVEGLILAVAGSAAGVLTARALISGLPAAIDARLDPSAFMAAGVATLVAVLVSAVFPAWSAVRHGVRAGLEASGTGGTGLRWRGRRWSIAGQVAVSVVLVLLAASAARHAAALASADLGVDVERLAAVVTLSPPTTDPDELRRSLETAGREVLATPGVEAVALASGLHISSGAHAAPNAYPSFAAGGETLSGFKLIAATPSIFRTLGIPVIAGRAFNDRDQASAAPVAVLGTVAAERLFGPTSPIGRELFVTRQSSAGGPRHQARPVTIVGVVDDAGEDSQDQESIYLPLAQHHEAELWMLARTSGDPAAAVRPMQEALHRQSPDSSLLAAGPAIRIARRQLDGAILVTRLATALGLFSLALAMTGLTAVLSHVVARRTREIGLRRALGATVGQVVAPLLREGLMPVAIGTAAGVAAGVLLRMTTRPILPGSIPEVDAWALVLVPVPMLLAGLVACYLPARRATLVDPNVALRDL